MKHIKKLLVLFLIVVVVVFAIGAVMIAKQYEPTMKKVKQWQEDYDIGSAIEKEIDVLTDVLTTDEETTVPTGSDETKGLLQIEHDETEKDPRGQFIGTSGVEFTLEEPFDCDGVLCYLERIKIKADSDRESSAKSYYEIFCEYTIQNNRSTAIKWNMAHSGNIYGSLSHRGVERRLGGNDFIRDEDFDELERNSGGTLAAGGNATGYNALICTSRIYSPYTGEYPEETWPLYDKEPFEMVLYLIVDDVEYQLNLSFNKEFDNKTPGS